MTARLIRLCSTFCLTLAFAIAGAALPAAAQDTPRIELAGGYQLVHLADVDTFNGWYADIAANLSDAVAVVGQVSGAYKSMEETRTISGIRVVATGDFSVQSYLGGVRVTDRRNPKVLPFAHALVGASRGTVTVTGTGTTAGRTVTVSESTSSTDAALQFGGGVNILVGSKIGVQIGGDYLRLIEEGGGVNGFRFAAGVYVPF